MIENAKAPFPPYEQDAAFHDLAALIQSGRPPIALIGAGASIESGYPSWPQLLRILKDAALRDDKRDWRRSIEDLSDAPWIAEVFAGQLKPGALSRLIRKQYSSRSRLSEPHLSLATMPFRQYLTTNYDPSIEEALQAAGRSFERLVWCDPLPGRETSSEAESLSKFLIGFGGDDADPHVVYLHGRYDSQEDRIILTESSYVARYIASDDARRKLMAIFMTHPVVFIGFSMNDPDLSNLMREVTARLKTSVPCHYALMGYKTEADREEIKARMIGKFGVRPVFFSRKTGENEGGEYANLLPLLDALAGLPVRPPMGPTIVSTPAYDPDDPHKGKFGGKAVANGRRLLVARKGGSENEDNLKFQLVVEPVDDGKPLDGTVTFHLHPSFTESVVPRTIRSGRATLTLRAYGAFTVGVEADNGATRLELDLATVETLPLWFRRQ